MLSITAVLVIGQLVLLAAFVLGVVAFFGLIAYDAFAGREATPPRADEQTAYVTARAA